MGPPYTGACPSDQGRLTLRCAVQEGFRQTGDASPARQATLWDVAYSTAARVPYQREGWSPMVRYNNDPAASARTCGRSSRVRWIGRGRPRWLWSVPGSLSRPATPSTSWLIPDARGTVR